MPIQRKIDKGTKFEAKQSGAPKSETKKNSPPLVVWCSIVRIALAEGPQRQGAGWERLLFVWVLH